MAAENNPPFENKTPWSVYVDFFYKYFVFSGRSSRYDYWAFIFTNTLVTVVLALLAAFDQSFYIIYYAYSLFTIIPFLALGVRRLHDIDKSGWYLGIPWIFILFGILISIIRAIVNYAAGNISSQPPSPFVGFSLSVIIPGGILATVIYLFYLFCKKGTPGANKYGVVDEDPRYNDLSRKYVAFAFIIPLIGFLSVGIISGYAKAKNNYATQKTADQIRIIELNVRESFEDKENYAGLNNQNSKLLNIVPGDMYKNKTDDKLINPFGGSVIISHDYNSFSVSYQNLPEAACQKLTEQDWGKDFGGFVINGRKNAPCDCLSEGCSVEWNFY